MAEMGLIDAARSLRLSYAQVLRLLSKGDLDGLRGSNGRWRVTKASVERVRRANEREAVPA